MSEMIIIYFPSEEEGITWNKRKPLFIHKKKEIVKKNENDSIPEIEDTIEPTTPNSMKTISKPKQIKQNEEQIKYILTTIEKVRLLEKKAKKNTSSNEKENITVEIKALETDLKNHKNYFSTPEQSHQYIQCIYELIHLQYAFGYKKESTNNNNQIATTKINNRQHSQKGIELEEQLIALKKRIQRNNLLTVEIHSLIKKLQEIKLNIKTNMSVFTKFDNIPMRLNQIEQYINHLKSMITTSDQAKRTNTTKNNLIETTPKKKIKVILRKHSLS